MSLISVGWTAAQTLTNYSAGFNNGNTDSSQGRSVTDYNWSIVTADAGEADRGQLRVGVSSEPGRAPVSAETDPAAISRGFLFASPGGEVIPRALLFHTLHQGVSDAVQDAPQPDWFRRGRRSLSELTVGDVDELSVYTRPASIHTVMRFAIRVDGEWYASKSFFKQLDTGVFEKHVINPAINEWITGVFISGSSLERDLAKNLTTPLNTSGVISGYGWYADTYALQGEDAEVQIDHYEIKLAVTSDPYLQWAIGPFANLFTDTDPDADFDHDGLSNLLEFVLGGDPTTADGPSVRPSITASGDDLFVTFRRSDASEIHGVTVKVQVGFGPDSWDPAADIVIGPSSEIGPNGAVYSVNEIGTLDTVVVTIPGAAAAGKSARVIAVRK